VHTVRKYVDIVFYDKLSAVDFADFRCSFEPGRKTAGVHAL